MTDEFKEWAWQQLNNQLKLGQDLLDNHTWVENKQQYQPHVLERTRRHHEKLMRMYLQNVVSMETDDGMRA